MGITTDGTNFYVTDYLNNVIRKIDSAGKVTTIAGSAGIAGLSDSTDKTGKTAFFNQPNGITIVGNLLYVVDSGNHMIRSVNKDTGETLRIAGTAGIAGNNDTSGGSPAFNSPIGITTDGTNLYVADSGNNTIRKIVILTGVVSTIAGNVAGPGSVDGISTAALFNLPTRLTTDGSFLYVTDFNNRTLRKVVIATGVVSTLAGNPNASAASIDTNTAANISATFYHLGGITTDGTDLYITEYNDTIESSPNWISLVRKVVISADGTTATVTTIAGGSVPVAVPTATQIVDDPVGTGGRARFVNPVGITTNGSGLYVTDGGFNNIRLLQKL